MTRGEARYYTGHSVDSDPEDLRAALDTLPKDPPALARAVAGVILDRTFVGALGVACPPESVDDAGIRRMPAMLRRILARDPAALATARPPERRFIGVCRHYALLACSAFRHHGVPARLRVGFANYFTPGFHDDHWVTEYRDDAGWRLMDAELTPGVCRHFGITFDACDVPRDRFVTAGAAWQAVRAGRLDPATCGVAGIGIAGAWFVAGSVVRDLAALNKRELLPWDYWGLSRDLHHGSPVPETTAARLDELAAMIAGRELDWARVRDVYERDDAMRVPPVVLSFPAGVPAEGAV